MALADRAGEKERVLIQARKAHLDGDETEWAAALPYFERVLRLDPAYEPAFRHQLWCLEKLGRPEEALVGGPRGAKWVMTASWMNRRWDDAARAGRRMVALDPRPAPRLQLATPLISRGDLPGAEAVVEPMVRGPVNPDSPAPSAAIVTYAAVLAGQGRRAEELARNLTPGREGERAFRGIRAWKDDRLDEAAALLRPIALPPVDDVWGGDHRPLSRLALAEVELARGDPAAALAALELLRLHPSPTAGYLTWTWVNPNGRLLEARTLDAVGRRAEALERCAALLDTLKGADDGYRLATEARALHASLAPSR